ncbi:MAG: transporter [Bacteroidales bacterium]|nr:transporter [Bacteroidales bacterium]
MKKSILFFALLLIAGMSHAQESLPELCADRPGVTWGADVLPFHKLSWENGVGLEISPGTKNWTLNTMIVRYGIFENVELRVGTDFLMTTGDLLETPNYGIAPLTVGTKVKVYEGGGFIPSVGFLAQLGSPHVGSKEMLPSHLAPSMYLIFENAFDNGFGVCYNAGLEWDGETAEPTKYLGISFGYGITDNVGVYCDFFNYLHSEGNQYMTEIGTTWMVNRKLQLDLEVDLDLQHLSDYVSLGCGVAWMIN